MSHKMITMRMTKQMKKVVGHEELNAIATAGCEKEYTVISDGTEM